MTKTYAGVYRAIPGSARWLQMARFRFETSGVPKNGHVRSPLHYGSVGESENRFCYCFGFHCLSRVMRWIPYLHHASSAPRARPARGNRHRQTQKCSEVTVLPQTRKTEKQWAHPSKSQPPMFFFIPYTPWRASETPGNNPSFVDRADKQVAA